MGRFRLLLLVHPYLFHFGRFVLPTYGFLLAVGTILSLLVCVRNARLLALDAEKIWTMALVSIAVLLAASKTMLVLLHWQQYGVRALGMSVYGTRDPAVTLASGALAGAAVVTYCLYSRLPLLRTLDALTPSLALGSAFLAIACLEAGCDYGTPTQLPWAIVFRSRNAAGAPLNVPLHPTQIYAGVIAFVLFVILLRLLYLPHGDGEILGAGLFLGAISNAALSPLRGEVGLWIGDAIPAGQLISLVMVLTAAWLWMRRPQTAPVVSRG